MLCENCGKNSAKQYVRKSDGKERTLYLCPACYNALYPAQDEDFFTSFLGNVGAKKECPACGATLDDFRATGLLGCAYCYTAFREELTPTVRYIQGRIRHEGKEPDKEAQENYDDMRNLVREREVTKAELEHALQAEDYALAEEYKLRLREINSRLYRGEGRK